MQKNTSQVLRGGLTPRVKEGKLECTPNEKIDAYLKELKSKQAYWAQEATLDERIDMLDRCIKLVAHKKEEWNKLDAQARHVSTDHWDFLTSLATNAGATASMLRDHKRALEDIKKYGVPKNYKKAYQDGDRVIIDTYPNSLKESIALQGFKGHIHLQKGTKLEELEDLQAHEYKDKNFKGGVCLVLGAGNISSLTVLDTLEESIIEKKVVMIKIHPVMEYMFDITKYILAPFIDAGVVRVIRGGSEVGQYVSKHELVDSIHITGSDKTFEAIVFGSGEEGAKNKAQNKRITNKIVEGELGNVTPLIVVPGDWSEDDFEIQADKILTAALINHGFTCVTARTLILPKHWDGSDKLIAKIKERAQKLKLGSKFYPGTDHIHQLADKYYPNAFKNGELTEDNQPFVFVDDLDSSKDEPAFRKEYWAAFAGATKIDSKDTEDFLKKAVKFCNEKLWGTLAVCVFIDDKTKKKLEESGDMKKAVDELRYGTVILNAYAGFANILPRSRWGGYPGSTDQDIQSGNCIVNNTLMLTKVEKFYLETPFTAPKPMLVTLTNPRASSIFKAVQDFNVSNTWGDLLKVPLYALGILK